MLPKSQRLSAAKVRFVLKNGRPLRVGTVSARYSKGDPSGAAVVVSTRVAKRAVDRNTLRRKGYQALPRLPHEVQIVFFIQNKDFNPADIRAVCSKLF